MDGLKSTTYNQCTKPSLLLHHRLQIEVHYMESPQEDATVVAVATEVFLEIARPEEPTASCNPLTTFELVEFKISPFL